MVEFIFFLCGVFFHWLSYLVLTLIHHENIIGYIWVIVATLIFIVAAMFYSSIISGPVSKMVSICYRVVYFAMGIYMLYIGIARLIRSGGDSADAMIFTVLLIEACYFLVQAFPSVYNSMVDMVYIVDDIREPVDELYQKFKEVDTPFGKPWVGKVKLVPDDCLIYGPAANDSYLFCHYSSGRFTITVGSDVSYLEDNEELESHRLESKVGFSDLKMGQVQNILSMLYPKMFYEMFDHYAKTGERKWVSKDYDLDINGKLYGFDEDFKIRKQEYHLLDQKGAPIYDVNSNFVRKTFVITKAQTGEEVFKITKRLFHIMPKYDFYKNGEKYGSLRQKVVFTRDVFKLQTTDGEIEVREINTTIGANYAVFLNGKVLGIISEKLNLDLKNIVFDNYILTVFDNKYLALLAGLAIMAQRERVRDREK